MKDCFINRVVNYYKAKDKVTGIYISKYNIMFEWNSFDTSLFGAAKSIKKIFTERETHSFDINSVNNSSVPNNTITSIENYYKQKIEKHITEHSYADTVILRLDNFEHSWKIYEMLKNYFVNHEGFNMTQDYIPENHAIFKRVLEKDDGIHR
jgi:hypothetical protein